MEGLDASVHIIFDALALSPAACISLFLIITIDALTLLCGMR